MHSFLEHRRLRVLYDDALAWAHLAITEVDELHRLSKMQAHTGSDAAARVGEYAFDECFELALAPTTDEPLRGLVPDGLSPIRALDTALRLTGQAFRLARSRERRGGSVPGRRQHSLGNRKIVHPSHSIC